MHYSSLANRSGKYYTNNVEIDEKALDGTYLRGFFLYLAAQCSLKGQMSMPAIKAYQFLFLRELTYLQPFDSKWQLMSCYNAIMLKNDRAQQVCKPVERLVADCSCLHVDTVSSPVIEYTCLMIRLENCTPVSHQITLLHCHSV